MDNVLSKECKFCNGSGYDPEHIGYKCWDCKGAGFEKKIKRKVLGNRWFP